MSERLTDSTLTALLRGSAFPGGRRGQGRVRFAVRNKFAGITEKPSPRPCSSGGGLFSLRALCQTVVTLEAGGRREDNRAASKRLGHRFGSLLCGLLGQRQNTVAQGLKSPHLHLIERPGSQ
jgi:hypothetical protein